MFVGASRTGLVTHRSHCVAQQAGMAGFQPLQPVAASGEKLAALFGARDAANVSLQFKAPRAPRPAAVMKAPARDPAGTTPAEATGANPGIAFAGTCHLFRYYEGGYQPVRARLARVLACVHAHGGSGAVDRVLSSACVAGNGAVLTRVCVTR